jgi:putative zinc finger protein
MTCREFDAQIDDYVDDVLNEALRAECDAHLSTCAQCRALTTDLRTIRMATRSLEPHVPSPQVWYRIAAAIETEPRDIVSVWFGGWQRALAGALTGVLIVAGLSWIGSRLAPVARDRVASTNVTTEPAAMDAAEFTLVEQQYTTAIAGLEDITMKERASLDDDTAEVLQANLTVIDGAIGESRAALDQQPESTIAQESLVEALRNKVVLLQDTVALINATRPGDTDTITGLNQ